jgi:DNA-binding CsgD family transcriptional regulator
MEKHGRVIAAMIDAIGEPEFAGAVAGSICDMADFQLSTVLVHRPRAHPELMYENFGPAGHATGLQNYIRFTHPANPFLAQRHATGVFRASDFAAPRPATGTALADYLVSAPDEELGFRTIGWPERLEEVGLYFRACGGIVEFSLYRQRGTMPTPVDTLHSLVALSAPLASAFERNRVLRRVDAPKAPPFAALTPREAEVADLLLTGCSTEAVALRLGIGRYTVKDHRKQIFRKLKVGSLAELFALAARQD